MANATAGKENGGQFAVRASYESPWVYPRAQRPATARARLQAFVR
eukprot:CAMPEP_0117553046 /NCGR_PEP_ID=MMETSP0784-20121206/50022_1 /TAXON_ID=39447 /ORGANISM="" /LENGTH=44 /DNA_ID= /DNA_START= /DNA_END= /DNA_ORIENTATION=